MRRALVVIDVQQGFEDPRWGRRDNPACEENIARLVDAWRERGEPMVYVRHDSRMPESPLAPGSPGNALHTMLDAAPDLFVTKSVNSAFYGTPDLHGWLQANGIEAIAICGITTNHCCETTARMAGNLGYDVDFVIDATYAFDMTAPDGTVIPAEQIRQVTAANLNGEFARVVSTDDVVAAARR